MAAGQARVTHSLQFPMQMKRRQTCQLATQRRSCKNWSFLVGEITRSSQEVKAEIQALGARTSDLEQWVKVMVQAHNSVVQHSTSMEQQITNLEMQVEDFSNRSSQNNLRIRGLLETPNEGPLIPTMEA
ncbi:Hypothetical predicted protein [Pelobates cultripes]|uniref:Uncharacterized protein n=1 Tax=Pelobates cultripes TaxID=61616 RepID=A0AAD1REE5_PELCU|nr:Hypothetical predicted protein [Pelobates cultripes]